MAGAGAGQPRGKHCLVIAWLVVSVVSVAVVALLVGAWMWVRRVESDDIDWEHGAQSSSQDQQSTQLGIALSANGSYNR